MTPSFTRRGRIFTSEPARDPDTVSSCSRCGALVMDPDHALHLTRHDQELTTADLVTVTITEDGGLTLVPGPDFDDAHAALLVALVRIAGSRG
ncbi:MAG: hypothetical protein OJJ54_25025 [Pseudonocardia sp.]|nr:hypothetical protein [Pseudonocardia sp.]